MRSLFLSYSFSKHEDRLLVSEIEDVVRCHNVVQDNGKHLGGDALTDEIRRRIEEADALVALATRRDQLASGRWTTHPWVRDEFGHARAHDKPAILILETEVDHGGAYAAHEWIELDRASPAAAMLKLSKTIALWRADAGRHLRVQLVAEDLDGGHLSECRYRFAYRGQYGEWTPGQPILEPGGCFLEINGVREGRLIEVQLLRDGQRWRSRATPQFTPIVLTPGT
ncbi:MAG: toll/interleukin-1 receptor domain-containing protein [Planctomycetota bacterium]